MQNRVTLTNFRGQSQPGQCYSTPSFFINFWTVLGSHFFIYLWQVLILLFCWAHDQLLRSGAINPSTYCIKWLQSSNVYVHQMCMKTNVYVHQLYVPGFMKNYHLLMRTFTFRLKLWKKKADSVKKSSNPKSCSIPPTAAAMDLEIKHAYYQTMIWKSRLQSGPSPMDHSKVHVLVYTFKTLQNQLNIYLYMALL